jgi:hypothetical protein
MIPAYVIQSDFPDTETIRPSCCCGLGNRAALLTQSCLLQVVNFDEAIAGGVIDSAHNRSVGPRLQGGDNG